MGDGDGVIEDELASSARTGVIETKNWHKSSITKREDETPRERDIVMSAIRSWAALAVGSLFEDGIAAWANPTPPTEDGKGDGGRLGNG